jgi:hypothetical protein
MLLRCCVVAVSLCCLVPVCFFILTLLEVAAARLAMQPGLHAVYVCGDLSCIVPAITGHLPPAVQVCRFLK